MRIIKNMPSFGHTTPTVRMMTSIWPGQNTHPHTNTHVRDEFRAKLLVIKRVGPWTVDMLAIFTLHRPDILPTGDLGVRKGMQHSRENKKG
jgi:hypothetical protein